jgi:thiamine transport system substrate-binding protein
MTYSSFMNAWGPGPEIAKRFRDETGLTVEFQDAGDAGLLLEKLKLFPVDVVIGLDRLSLDQAREHAKWRELDSNIEKFRESNFVPFDWAPLAFVYRKGEINPPTSLRDLLDPRFAGAIALEDPRTSTPGLAFFLWVLDAYGEDEGFKFLAALKPNIQSVSPSWSTAYGAFSKKQSKLVLSYQTSPIYHLLEEKDANYEAAAFTEGQPVQVEYAGIPNACFRCGDAEVFIHFLLKEETQKLIMRKNFMLPVASGAMDGTPFASVPEAKTTELKSAPALMKRRNELFEKWRKLGL